MTSHRIRRHRIEPLWTRVDRNRLKTLLFVVFTLTAMSLAVAVVVVPTAFLLTFEHEAALTWLRSHTLEAFLGAFSLGFVLFGLRAALALAAPEKRLLKKLGATLTKTGELLPTKYVLKDMSLAGGLEHSPPLYVLETDSVNAFVMGRSPEKGAVGVTRGLVSKLTDDEQRAVFANLIARLVSGDTIYATTNAALMTPLWRWRQRQLSSGTQLDCSDSESAKWERAALESDSRRGDGPGGLFLFGVPFMLAVFGSELLTASHRAHHVTAGEKADAEGMLLLKDPMPMLTALQKIVRFDNLVPTAGPELAQLFYSWSDLSTNDEDDPEMRRIARLREVLGVVGWADERREIERADLPDHASPPVAPWREGEDGGSA